jgi:hypothetical protein
MPRKRNKKGKKNSQLVKQSPQDDSVASDSALNEQFAQLALSRNLVRGSKKYNQLRGQHFTNKFNGYFGDVTVLNNWQRLCDDLGIQPIPESKTACKKVRGLSAPHQLSLQEIDMYVYITNYCE